MNYIKSAGELLKSVNVRDREEVKERRVSTYECWPIKDSHVGLSIEANMLVPQTAVFLVATCGYLKN